MSRHQQAQGKLSSQVLLNAREQLCQQPSKPRVTLETLLQPSKLFGAGGQGQVPELWRLCQGGQEEVLQCGVSGGRLGGT